MRQGNGTDILGSNDPRSAGIGIIYVAPNDDRQSVLAAILTQEKLGRKIVVVNLPDQNKAFQRPADFDGLKSMRRKLQSQIVFIAPSGPGPAEFARQRRFPVYSSLESYAAELRGQGQAQQGEKKGGWSFGRKQKPADVTPPRSVARRPQTRPLAPISMVPLGQSSDDDDTKKEDEQTAPNGGAAVAGAAAGVAAGVAMSRLAADDDDTIAPPSHEDDGWDTLPPAGSAPQVVNSSPLDSVPGQEEPQTQSAGPTDDNEDTAPGPNIIELPQPRNINGGNEPTPVVLPVPTAQPGPPPASAMPRRRTSGQMAAIGGVGMAAEAAGAGMARRASGGLGGGPPTRAGAGGRGGAGGPRRRSGWRWLLAIALILLTLFLIFMGIAYAAPGVFGLAGVLPGTSPTATVTITPASKDLKNTYVISAVTGTPNASQRQVQARLLSSTTPSQSKTVNATGTKTTAGVQATGTLTFYNGKNVDQKVNAGTTFNVAGGVQIVTDADVDIPAATPGNPGVKSVSAHAVPAGVSGDIAALTINQFCCSTDGTISVKNLSAFAGGQNPQNYTFVQQSDIDGAANPLVKPLTQSAQTDLQKQIHPGEKLVSPMQCTSNVTSDHVAGDKASTVTVTVSVKCTGEVYDQQGALLMGMNLLKTQAMTDPGAGYALVGNLVTGVTQATVIDPKGTISLLVKAEGVWVYQFSDASKHQLARLIAGKSKKDAQALLLRQTGVSQVNIAISAGGTTLPTDSGQITILVQNVPGLSGTATPATGPSTPTTPGSTPSPSRGTQTPVVGGGG